MVNPVTSTVAVAVRELGVKLLKTRLPWVIVPLVATRVSRVVA